MPYHALSHQFTHMGWSLAAQSQGFVAASDMTMTDWVLTTDHLNCTFYLTTL